ncbi:MAG: hypothetical protein AAFR28_04665 [Pseudomonadota bacterium]
MGGLVIGEMALSALGPRAGAIVADNVSSLQQSMPLFLSIMVLVMIWAVLRPAFVKDSDGRSLPWNAAARLMFILIYMVGYTAITAFALAIADFFQRENVDAIDDIFQSFGGEAPLIAGAILFTLNGWEPFREAEKGLLAWLHSAAHHKADVRTLRLHLVNSEFDQSAEERARNVADLRKFDVFMKDNETQSIRLSVVDVWRKVATLLRLVRSWNEGANPVLSSKELELLEVIEQAHWRKTKAALDIVRMIDHISQGRRTVEAFGQVALLLQSTSHNDREKVAEIEDALRKFISDGDGPREIAPLRVSSEEFERYLEQVEAFFEVEYAKLLEQISDLAAKSIVLAGEQADDRLEQTAATGFMGLGEIRPFTFDYMIWTFGLVCVGSFMLMLFGRETNVTAEQLLIFSFSLSAAALIGSMVGSRRALAASRRTKWAYYLAAGAGAVLTFMGIYAVHSVVDFGSIFDYVANKGTGALSQQNINLSELIRWGTFHLFIAMSIALLARKPRWPSFLGLPSNIAPRIIDGLIMAVGLNFAFLVSIATYELTQTPLPDEVPNPYASGELLDYFNWAVFCIGFFIGALIVRDVRMSAHTKIVEDGDAATRRAFPVEGDEGGGEDKTVKAVVESNPIATAS